MTRDLGLKSQEKNTTKTEPWKKDGKIIIRLKEIEKRNKQTTATKAPCNFTKKSGKKIKINNIVHSFTEIFKKGLEQQKKKSHER